MKKVSLQAITSKPFSEIQVYPNPAKEKIWIKTNNPVEIKHLKIINLTGKTVFESRFSDDKREIDVSALKRGIYILNIAGKVNYSGKLIINP